MSTNHAEAFRAAARGHDVYTVSLALNTFTPGCDWRGCTRTQMAEAYSLAMQHKHGNPDRGAQLRAVNLDQLTRRLNARLIGNPQWKTLP